MTPAPRRSVDVSMAGPHLDELVAAVEQGEIVELTRHGVVVALVSPMASLAPVIDSAWLQRMADAMPLGALEECEAVRRLRDLARY